VQSLAKALSPTLPSSPTSVHAPAAARDVSMPRYVRLRPQAVRDLDEAVGYYASNASDTVVTAFIDTVESAVRRLAKSPSSGSLRYAYELELPGLRVLPLRDFPHLIFYRVVEDSIDVWRVLHSRRDVAAELAGEDS
jgi:toxin ParE1/3/4